MCDARGPPRRCYVPRAHWPRRAAHTPPLAVAAHTSLRPTGHTTPPWPCIDLVPKQPPQRVSVAFKSRRLLSSRERPIEPPSAMGATRWAPPSACAPNHLTSSTPPLAPSGASGAAHWLAPPLSSPQSEPLRPHRHYAGDPSGQAKHVNQELVSPIT
jgi:hypothetical protein